MTAVKSIGTPKQFTARKAVVGALYEAILWIPKVLIVGFATDTPKVGRCSNFAKL